MATGVVMDGDVENGKGSKARHSVATETAVFTLCGATGNFWPIGGPFRSPGGQQFGQDGSETLVIILAGPDTGCVVEPVSKVR